MAETPDDLPEPDRLDGAPHPRETMALFGQDTAERELLASYASGRMHHAWILGGPPGIGKATLAYRLARFIFAHPDPAAPEVQSATSLHVPADHPAVRQVVRMAHPDLLVLRRGWVHERKAVSSDIRVADVRRVGPFFGSTAGQGGWRICIVDAAEDLNINGANAILKTLEEPPRHALFLIVSSSPRRLLPTIRSRCRLLMLSPLAPQAIVTAVSSMGDDAPDIDDQALHAVAGASEGSVRRAIELASGEGHELREMTSRLLDAWPNIDRAAVHTLGDKAARGGSEAYEAVMEQALDWVHARTVENAGARGDQWPELWSRASRMVRDADTFNLDRKPLILNFFFEISELR